MYNYSEIYIACIYSVSACECLQSVASHQYRRNMRNINIGGNSIIFSVSYCFSMKMFLIDVDLDLITVYN